MLVNWTHNDHCKVLIMRVEKHLNRSYCVQTDIGCCVNNNKKTWVCDWRMDNFAIQFLYLCVSCVQHSQCRQVHVGKSRCALLQMLRFYEQAVSWKYLFSFH